jgi:hypothetical protein
MPTGYTAGILDGEIKSFSEFAKLCVRNFGAAMHMRDWDFKSEYKKAEPMDYHPKQLEKAKNDLENLNKITDSELVREESISLLEERKRCLKRMEEIRDQSKVLGTFLAEAIAWTPPTKEHQGYKEFMVNQITETIKFDCSVSYYQGTIQDIDKKMALLNAKSIREERKAKHEKDIKYHTEEYNKEVERINKSNEWVQQIFNTLEVKVN